jgi:hypothetical protein
MDENTYDLPDALLEELSRALSGMTFGSIELYVQNGVVTQITVRNIKKTSVNMKEKKTQHITAAPMTSRISTQGKIHIKLRP